METIRMRRYLIDGREGTQQNLAAQAFIVAGADLPDEGTAYGFSTEDLFCRWAADTRHADRIARAIGTMKLGQQLENTDTAARALKRQEASVQRIQGELQGLARDTHLSMGSSELLIRASAHRSTLEGPIFDPTLLFDKVDDSGPVPAFSGPVFPVFAGIPTFFGFNDKASGALVIGLCTLFDRTFFRGPAAFLIGAAGFVLADIGFENRAASGIAV